MSFFSAFQARLEVLKFEISQIKLENNGKTAIKWQNFAQVELQLKFAFRIRLLVASDNRPPMSYFCKSSKVYLEESGHT